MTLTTSLFKISRFTLHNLTIPTKMEPSRELKVSTGFTSLLNVAANQADEEEHAYERQHGVVNIAKIGTLTTSTPSARPPADLLKRPSTPPPRGASWSSCWSYYFNPDFPEITSLDLLITLPRPVYLTEVQIRFHGGPTAHPPTVEVQVAKDLQDVRIASAPTKPLVIIPLESPMESWISVPLTSPHTIRKVLLRIFKPKESRFVYIPRIKLMEPVGFDEVLGNSLIEVIKPDRLITFKKIFLDERKEEFSVFNLYKRIFQSEAEVNDIWNYCLYALTDPTRKEASLTRVTGILLHFDMQPPPTSPVGPNREPLMNKLIQELNHPQPQLDAVIGLVYDLCCTTTTSTKRVSVNITALVRWLEDTMARLKFEAYPAQLGYMKAFSAALWTLAEGNGRGLDKSITSHFIKKMYEWSMKLDPKTDTKLKTSIDYIICSACYCRPWLFVYLMYSIGLFKVKDGIDLSGINTIHFLEQWYNEGNLWTKLKLNELGSPKLIDLSGLDTLAMAARSWTSVSILKGSFLVEHFNSKILEFCTVLEEAGENVNQSIMTMTPTALVHILKFYLNLCFMNTYRSWFTTTEGLDSWLPVFTLLTTLPNGVKYSLFGDHQEELESTMIYLLVSLCWTCIENQKRIFPLLRKVILKESSDPSPFISRLLISLLLENENVFVRVKSGRKFSFMNPCPLESISVVEDMHPCSGVKGMDRLLDVKASAWAYDILRVISEEEDFNLRLEIMPEFGIPRRTTIQQLITIQGRQSRGRMPLLDMVELQLGQEIPLHMQGPGQAQEEEKLFNPPPLPSILDVFCEDGGLELIFQRLQFQSHAEPITGIVIDSISHFLNLPCYSDVLLEEIFQYRTNLLIRLGMGKTTDQEGRAIRLSPDFDTLETLPFEVLNWLLDTQPPEAEVGQLLRGCMVHGGAFQFLLEYMDKIVQTQANSTSTAPEPEPVQTASVNDNTTATNIWAKGTGYGMGPIAKSGQGLAYKEEMLTCLLNVIANFFGDIPELSSSPEVVLLLGNSGLVKIVSGYLINDSVLDIAVNFPLYRVILQLVRTLAPVPQYREAFVPKEGDLSIPAKLKKMKEAVDSYVKLVKATNAQDLDLAQLIQDIEATISKVEEAETEFLNRHIEDIVDLEEGADTTGGPSPMPPAKLEEIYVEKMEKFRFEYYEMIVDGPFFRVPYHYEDIVRANWSQAGPRISSRGKRLIQEVVTLSKSLPLSSSSSIFMRVDKDRLDVIKVLITGPSGTPYANGCFEFDIHFPLNYPHAPPMIHFETTGGGKIRFNPNLYDDGKVCLSILGTWPGAPEEQWNPKTSSLLLVLVAIQSLILNEEPYWNEPLWQVFGGTEKGVTKAKEYKAYVRYYTLQYAILGQMQSPPSCFTEVIQRHFWMKKEEILKQCEEWEESTSVMDEKTRVLFKQTVTALKSALSNMVRPEGMEDV